MQFWGLGFPGFKAWSLGSRVEHLVFKLSFKDLGVPLESLKSGDLGRLGFRITQTLYPQTKQAIAIKPPWTKAGGLVGWFRVSGSEGSSVMGRWGYVLWGLPIMV